MNGLFETANDIPQLLRACESIELPPASWLERSWICTGAGLSSQSAELLARLVPTIEYKPLSYFVGDGRAQRCILFSQSLSPNARLARGIGPNIAFSGAKRHQLSDFLNSDGFLVAVPGVELHQERVRLQSPVAAAYLSMRWASTSLGIPWQPNFIAEAYEAAFEAASKHEPPRASESVVFVTTDDRFSFGSKWAEATRRAWPQTIDVLDLGHGPLETLYREDVVFILLTTEACPSFLKQLEQSIGHRHRVIELSAKLPKPLSFFEHDAGLNRILFAHLTLHPAPPIQVEDGPLYELTNF